MDRSWAAEARAILSAKGLAYFDDVLDELRAAPIDRQAAVAVAAACRCARKHLKTAQVSSHELSQCFAALELMWKALREPTDSGREHVRAAVAQLHGAAVDAEPDDEEANRIEDAVAAVVYAGDSVADGRTGASAWAATRLIDHTFSLIDDDQAIELDSSTFVRQCSDQRVQRELAALRAMMELVRGPNSPAVVAALRTLAETG
jgi:hypothetical protein